MGHRPRFLTRRSRAWTVGAYVGICVLAGVIASAFVLPHYFSNAGTSGVSTIHKTGTNLANGSTAASPYAPGGEKTGTAKPGDQLRWVVSYQNDTSGSASVALTDVLTDAGAYVPDSLQLPPNQNPAGALTPQFSIDGGTSWRPGSPPAGATGVGFTATAAPTGTQQLSAPFEVATSSTISVSGGDAYNAVVRDDLVYALWHHNPGPFLYCAQLNGATCPGWPTNGNVQSWSPTPGTPIGTGTPFSGTTPQQNGTWIDGDRMYWYVGPADNSSTGVACLDLSTTTPTSCGYRPTAAKAVSNTQLAAMVGGTGLPASNGNYYAVAANNGYAVITCATKAGVACANIPLIITMTSPNVLASATFGDYVFASVQQSTTAAWRTYCYNIKAGAFCSGSWPQSSSTAVSRAGTPFAPVLSTSGALTGVCTIINGAGTASTCLNLTGGAIPNPYAGTGAVFSAGGNGSGDAFTVGSRVYISTGNQVTCRDFAAYSGSGTVPACAGFTSPVNKTNYTVRAAGDVAPDCLVASGDAGQITFFDRFSGGACLQPSPQSVTVSPRTYYCGTESPQFRWSTLSFPGLVTTAYTGSTVSLRDQNGAPIPGYDARDIPAGQTVDLQAIPSSVQSITATVTLNGVRDPAGVRSGQISLAWSGEPPQMCFTTTAPPVACDAGAPSPVKNSARAVTTSKSESDAPAGHTTGSAVFFVKAEDDQCSLAIAKTSSVQTARPGERVDYQITITNTGSQAYADAQASDDLSDVLQEATYGNDAKASSGAVSYTAPLLSWKGALAAGDQATITYTATVKNPASGDHRLVNSVTSPSRGNNCPPDSSDTTCTAIVGVLVSTVQWHKVDAGASRNTLAGAEWTLTPLDASGKPAGPSIVVADCVASSANQCANADTEPLGGLFRVTDLGPGSYELVETRAPTGFLLNTTPILVTVSATSATVELDDIVNEQIPVPAIPFTGGLGADSLTITGSAVLALAAALGAWYKLKRRRAA
ncbi:SpaA isopeptide-forming pilin-related protein [Leifsonia sp. NPDC014704]|uniref:DUF7927 domain-containing protein n=1 Tax=Leifsonia sp. NPDC014704 TaxID=3364123 RepID=UPI0036F48A28